MKLTNVFFVVLLMIEGVNAESQSIADNFTFDLNNGVYLQLLPQNNIATNGTIDSANHILSFWINNTQVNFSANTNKTLSNLRYNNITDELSWTASGIDGFLNVSVLMKNANINYDLKLDGAFINTQTSNIDGLVSWNYSGWSTHNFTISQNSTQGAPNILSWWNSVNGWNQTAMSITAGNSVTFNVTMDQTVTNVSWKVEGSEKQNTSSIEFTRVFSSIGIYNVTAQAFNANGSSQIVYTVVTVNPIPQDTWNITGFVYDNNGAGLGSVTVLNNTNTTSSLSNGSYTLTGIGNGTWNFSYSKTNFITGYKEITISGADVANQNITIWNNASPAQVSGMTEGTKTDVRTNISWAPNSETDLWGYEIFRNGTHLTYAQNNYYNDTGLVAGILYQYAVRANDTYNNWGDNSTILNITTILPTAPSISDIVNGAITSSTGIINYTVNQSSSLSQVRYSINSDLSDFSQTSNLTSGDNRSHTLSGLTSGKTYYYTVFAYNLTNTSYYSNSPIYNFTTLVGDKGQTGGSGGGGGGGGWVPTPTPTPTQTASTDFKRKDYYFRIAFQGEKEGRIELTNSEEHGIAALNIYFAKPVTGIYTFMLSTYEGYPTPLNGSTRYFSIAPNFDMKTGSSIELISEQGLELFQLYGNDTWKKMPKNVRVSANISRIPVTSFGVFAVKPLAEKQSIKTAAQSKQAATPPPDKFESIKSAIEERLAWIVEKLEQLKTEIKAKFSNLYYRSKK